MIITNTTVELDVAEDFYQHFEELFNVKFRELSHPYLVALHIYYDIQDRIKNNEVSNILKQYEVKRLINEYALVSKKYVNRDARLIKNFGDYVIVWTGYNPKENEQDDK